MGERCQLCHLLTCTEVNYCRDPMPCLVCNGRTVRSGMTMPDGRTIYGSICTQCGTTHDAEGAN